jgi:hypothetical protein
VGEFSQKNNILTNISSVLKAIIIKFLDYYPFFLEKIVAGGRILYFYFYFTKNGVSNRVMPSCQFSPAQLYISGYMHMFLSVTSFDCYSMDITVIHHSV